MIHTHSRIRQDDLDFAPLHTEVIIWVNMLIIDLKLQALGQQPNAPIDMTRLNQWAAYRMDLEACKQRLKWY